MRTVAEHQHAVRELLAGLAGRGTVEVEVSAGALARTRDLDRVLGADVFSPVDHPPFDNSQMDGYAVRSGEVVAGRRFVVAARIAAGAPVGTLEPGTAAPIMTGAPIPEGADAVIPIEAATPDSFPRELGSGGAVATWPGADAARPGPAGPGDRAVVEFAAAPQPGSYVRPRSSDLAAGALLLPSGTRLGPAQWGMLAASGITRVPVLRRLSVLVLSTGDELRAPGATLAPGQIFDANSTIMTAAISGGGAAVIAVRTVTDDAAALRAILAREAATADLIVTTGGVSKGAYEVVRDVFEPAGVAFGPVAMQPGGPQGLGIATLADETDAAFEVPVVAFPGNPVSALVSFEMFLRPVLRELHGLPGDRPSAIAGLASPLVSPAAKHQVRRGRLDSGGAVELVGGPSSHLLHGYAISTLLVHIPPGVSGLGAGDPVETWSIID